MAEILEIISGEYDTNIIIGDPVEQKNFVINFHGNNSKVIIHNNTKFYNCKFDIYSESLIEIGNDTILRGSYLIHNGCKIIIKNKVRCNGEMNIRTAEKTKVEIGKECLISRCTIRSSDMHRIYLINTNERLNNAKDIKIEDHVWMGQDCFILKGVTVGKDSVIGANAVVTKNVPPNSVVAGNPAIIVRTGINWDGKL